MKPSRLQRRRQQIHELCLFPLFAALMYASKMLMEALPNIHLLGMFTLLLTLVYRWKALIPIYLYAILLGVTYGFDPLWWPIHLYVWTVLWAIGMLLPRNLPKKAEVILYPLLCALHGLCYGALCAPYTLFAMTGSVTLAKFTAYVASGLSFDLIHAAGNFCLGFLVLPLKQLLVRIGRTPSISEKKSQQVSPTDHTA